MKQVLQRISEFILNGIRTIVARTSSSPRFRFGLAISAVMLFILINIFAFSWGKRLAQTRAPKIPIVTPTPTPTPIPMREHGKITFTINSGKKDGPQFQQGYIDPVDPENGQIQKLGIWVRDTTSIASVSATMNMDHSSTPVIMKQTDKKGDAVLYEGSLTVSDTYLYRYTTDWSATNGTITNSFQSTWR